ncbi:MAG: CDP-glucose 4,6-dehydratase [Pelagibacteraceae bacterium TMED124]|nr:MAG: CDP-glucose 4,6-dehydratase [Pelagibacteraceae bacterium TMED124]|tara:strand:+ start:5170 stop:6243 length:1074 start_codon:yes stop_codon:yes gene_type:complete
MGLNEDFWHNKKVLLTGHTGFKGSWLLLLLIKLNAKVVGYALPPETKPNLFMELELNIKNKFINNFGDIRDKKNLHAIVNETKPDIVFHLAAQPLVRMSYQKPLETWDINVMGTLNLLDSLKDLNKKCAVVVVTTDKVYFNREWEYSYRENDLLGGFDPYSASKAATEIALSSWRSSFCGTKEYQTNFLSISSARSGNVIGGGDWSLDRIVPDAIRALSLNNKIMVRNPKSTRPWQHVLDPLVGYIMLAENLLSKEDFPKEAFNFGPYNDSNKNVSELLKEIFKYWKGEIMKKENPDDFHEANLLNLQIDKAYSYLNWKPNWNFEETVKKTTLWYKNYNSGKDPYSLCSNDIDDFLD